MNENIRVLFEMGKIEEPNEELARNFCRASKIGTYKCAVTTRFGFSCDLCLEEELLYLKSVGVHTVASCCGHGNSELPSILLSWHTSREVMHNKGFELICYIYWLVSCSTKSMLLYDPPEGEEEP